MVDDFGDIRFGMNQPHSEDDNAEIRWLNSEAVMMKSDSKKLFQMTEVVSKTFLLLC